MLLEAVKLQAKLLSMAEKEFTFPNMLFSRICEACWSLEARSSSSPTNVQHLTAAWVSLLDEYADLKYFFYRNIG